MSKEEFLQKLENKNKYYESFFIVAGEYKNNYTKILLKDKYGFSEMTPKNLLRGYKPSLVSAIDKTDYFLKKLFEKNKYYREGKLKVLGEYKIKDKPIIVKTKYGYLKVYTNNLLKGKFPIQPSAIFPTEYFKNKLHCKNKFYRKRLFSIEGEYTTNKGKIKVKIKENYYEANIRTLLEGGVPSITTAKNPFKTFKNELKIKNKAYREGLFEVHGEYKNRKDSIKVTSKYGECIMPISSLLGGSSPSITSAVDKKEYFKNLCKNSKSKNIKVLGEYVDSKNTILCECKNCKRQPYKNHNSILKGSGCSHCNAGKMSLDKIEERKELLSTKDKIFYIVGWDCGIKIGFCRDFINRFSTENKESMRILRKINTNEYKARKAELSVLKHFSDHKVEGNLKKGGNTEFLSLDIEKEILCFADECQIPNL